MLHVSDVCDYIGLSKVQHSIDQSPVDSSIKTIELNLAFISEIAKPSCILAILAETMNDTSMLTAVASRSYRHVNHFDKIVLLDSAQQQGYRLTLHLWIPPYTEKELNDELIHDHRFSFWSSVLTGNLVSENFSRSEVGTMFQQYQYVPEKRGLSTMANFYQFIGPAALARAEPSWKSPGESYYLSYERIHRVLLPRASVTCTLVLRGPRQRNHSNVYNTTYPTTNTQMENMMFSEDQVRERLSKLTDAIEKTRL